MTGEGASGGRGRVKDRRLAGDREAAVGVTIFFGGHRRRKEALPLAPPKKMVGPRRP